MAEAHCWLVKTEPGSYSIDDLQRDGRTAWTGVRNYQARNLMRDRMAAGDPVLFYHSSTEPPGVAGVATVIRSGYPDPSARDEKSDYFDPKASDEDPRWFMVDIRFDERFPTIRAELDKVGLDPAADWLPVAPAAHYTCGGVWVDHQGETDLRNLYAIGEVAFTGMHGANRTGRPFTGDYAGILLYETLHRYGRAFAAGPRGLSRRPGGA